MEMPEFYDLTLPLLKLASQGKDCYEDVRPRLAKQFGLSRQQVNKCYSSQVNVFTHRIRLAKLYLTKARLLRSDGRGKFCITKRGMLQLGSAKRLDEHTLCLHREFIRFRQSQGFQPV